MLDSTDTRTTLAHPRDAFAAHKKNGAPALAKAPPVGDPVRGYGISLK